MCVSDGKVDVERNPQIATRELWVLNLLIGAGMPVPELYYAEDSGAPFLVLEFIEGHTVERSANLRAYLQQMASILAKIHSTVYSKADLAFLPDKEMEFREKLAQRPAQLDTDLSEGRIRDALERVPAPRSKNNPVLLHGDFWPGNILWKDDKVAALIDWEDTGVGDPLIDLSNARLEICLAHGPDAGDENLCGFGPGPVGWRSIGFRYLRSIAGTCTLNSINADNRQGGGEYGRDCTPFSCHDLTPLDHNALRTRPRQEVRGHVPRTFLLRQADCRPCFWPAHELVFNPMTRRTMVIKNEIHKPHMLQRWGFDSDFQQEWENAHWTGIPGRVLADHGEFFTVVTAAEDGEPAAFRQAVASGKLRHQIQDRQEWPQVGDFAAVEPAEGTSRIVGILPRRTALIRKNPGESLEAQVMVANLDKVFILASMNQPINSGRLERSLAIAWDSGADPVIILTKRDLADQPEALVKAAEQVAMGVPVLSISVLDGDGLSSLERFLCPSQTIALLGPSGVGKSTLINHLLGESRQIVQAIRADDGRGRHTTTHREIFQIACGALLVDIPGIREVGLWDGGTSAVFADIEALALACRFTDCQHVDEPGCAVKRAVAASQLDEERLHQYRKMERELQHLERKRSARAQSEERQIWKQRAKDARQKRKWLK